MKILKKDFVNENEESYCAKGHRLSSGTAYYMQAKDGTIHYGGKQCAETHGSNDLRDVPDLTKSLVSLGTQSNSGGGGEGRLMSKENLSLLPIYYCVKNYYMTLLLMAAHCHLRR